MSKEYAIRNKIAKHGENSIIVIPRLLREELKPKMIVKVNTEVLSGLENA
jgi:hypothetical protein